MKKQAKAHEIEDTQAFGLEQLALSVSSAPTAST